MMFSTMIPSLTAVYGKCSLAQFAGDRHLAVNSSQSGIPAVKLGPAQAHAWP